MMYKYNYSFIVILVGFIFVQATLLSIDSLSLDEAVARTLQYSPVLRIATSEIEAREGLQTQSLLLPNPIASYSVENVFGNKKWHGWQAAESRYELAQLIELGGKRDYRYNVATYLMHAAQEEYETTKLVVMNRLVKAFVEVAFAQELFTLAQEQRNIADEVFKSVSAKVEAGKVSAIQKNKAHIALSTAHFTLEKARVDFEKAKERLSILWGSSSPDFNQVVWPFYDLEVPISYEACHSCLEWHPALIQVQLESLAACQSLNLEKAVAVPDVVISVGYKTELRHGEKGMVFGAALPLPIFNQNQGNVENVRSKVQQSQDRVLALQLQLENRLSLAHKELLRAYREADQLRTTVLKTAEQSFQYAQEGYKEGKFEYLDMLDSQRTLFEIKERYIQVLLFYHKSKTDIYYLISEDDVP